MAKLKTHGPMTLLNHLRSQMTSPIPSGLNNGDFVYKDFDPSGLQKGWNTVQGVKL